MKFAIFAKHLQTWPLAECADRVAAAGFDGLDLTVRPAGYIDPAVNMTALATAVTRIRAAGLAVPLITTGIISASDPTAEPVIRAAGELGIPDLKLHYWPWDGLQNPLEAVEIARRELASLVPLAAAAGVRLNIHNHSGNHVQSSPWAVEQLLRDHPPATVGAYFDPAHYTIEGGLAGWRIAARLLARRTTLLAVKDNRWLDVGPGRQERRWVPVGTGNTPWPESIEILNDIGFSGWASVHGEYQGRWSFQDLDAAGVLAQAVRDREYLKSCCGIV